jgi:PAS domain S-box-containing protein
LDGIITSWNAAAERIFGYRTEEIVGQPMRRLLPEDRQGEEDLILARLRRGERIDHFETVRRDKAGRLLEVSITISPLRDAQGSMIGASTIARDITARKQAEAERTRLLAELQQFAYIVSHDLTEPLRTIRSYVELLAQRFRGKLDPTADEHMAFVTGAAQRLQQMLTALLAYTRIGGSAAQSTAVDCEAVLAGVLSDLQLVIRESGAKVTHDGLPTAYGDAGQVGLVFQNLIGNAMKFRGPAPPRIHLSSHREGAQWVVAVQDNGIGIDPQYAERIFQIFQRLHTRSEYPGTGIGLAICKKIIERHEGRIWVESRPGQGATFFFTLPAYAPGPQQASSRKDGDSK